MPHIVIYNQLGVPPNFFKDLKGAAKQKRLKNIGLVVAALFLCQFCQKYFSLGLIGGFLCLAEYFKGHF